MADFENVSQSLSRRLGRRGLQTVAEAAHVCSVANTIGQGEFIAMKFRGGQLTIRARNAVVAQELQFQRDITISKIREAMHWPVTRPLRLLITLR